uniref:Vesicle transport protein n=1 Tax=Strongyloides stercoralis TaxID=6248 RepID=A0A0K0EJN6_STRER
MYHQSISIGENNEENTSNTYNGTGIQDASKMDWTLRVQCFIGCFFLSIFASLCSSFLLIQGKLNGYAVLVSVGSIISIIGSLFLSGPAKQLRNMFEEKRIFATCIYIISIIMSFIAAMVLKSVSLAIICIIIQYLAMAWYSLSYIPYAHNFIKKLFSSCC